jgi:hypothetical protein
MYEVYLRLRRDAPLPWSITRTPCRETAIDAFTDIVNCMALDCLEFEAAFTHISEVLAVHRFMSEPGSGHYWRGRIGELP